MAQFDVYPNPRPSHVNIPFLLDVQSNIVDISTRVVVPLVHTDVFGPTLTRLHPVVTVKTQEVVVSTADMAGVPRRDLGSPVTSLSHQRDRIIAALDWLLTGV